MSASAIFDFGAIHKRERERERKRKREKREREKKKQSERESESFEVFVCIIMFNICRVKRGKI